MKKVLIISILSAMLLLTTTVYGSGFGIRAGLNFSSIPSKTEIIFPDEGGIIEALPDSYTGFHFGVFSHFSLLGIFIQPELLYTRTGQEMLAKDANESGDIYFTNTFNHLSLPVIGGIQFGPLRAGLGPIASLLLSDSQGFSEYKESVLDFDYNRVSIGYQAMVGIKLSNLMLDFKYEGSLSRFGDGINIGETPLAFDTRPRQFIISLGIMLN